jgi:hypothetical protein
MAQLIRFARGHMNPKACTYAQAWILLLYQILFVFTCLSLAPSVISGSVSLGMSVGTAVAWSVSSMMLVSASM